MNQLMQTITSTADEFYYLHQDGVRFRHPPLQVKLSSTLFSSQTYPLLPTKIAKIGEIADEFKPLPMKHAKELPKLSQEFLHQILLNYYLPKAEGFSFKVRLSHFYYFKMFL